MSDHWILKPRCSAPKAACCTHTKPPVQPRRAMRNEGDFRAASPRGAASWPSATHRQPLGDKSDLWILKPRCSSPKAPPAKTYHITTDKLAQEDDYNWALDTAPATAQEPTHASPFSRGRPSGPGRTVLRLHHNMRIHEIFAPASAAADHCKPIMQNAPYAPPGPGTSSKSTPLPLRLAHSPQEEFPLGMCGAALMLTLRKWPKLTLRMLPSWHLHTTNSRRC